MNKKNDSLLGQKSVAKPLPWWQKRTFTISVALLGLIIILAIMTINVAKFETHLATGDTVLLELAPIDPRGFMQGDYMTLSYALERDVFDQLNERLPENEYYIKASEGYVIVTLDENNVGTFSRLVDTKPNHLASNEMALHYRVRNNKLKLATNAFFFQEGHAEAFEMAEYGLFRVNDKGEPLLTDMVDGVFKVIEPEVKSVENEAIQNNPKS
ncbi:GDYXXLXY domain-containing protein [Psychrobacter sp. K31L]|uniref:GDYXXLXY domain-containing protein n=1 Tax=Psychrobacter sp. K31L TaxID=2820758 RepID=UPI001B32B462|nr:GDYXXLXY domain-containing protein [Psychrobacter sp. K31L]MBP3946310.1 GDYXXLXY domain-containing protein [Psychrobacter sp. K31L]